MNTEKKKKWKKSGFEFRKIKQYFLKPEKKKKKRKKRRNHNFFDSYFRVLPTTAVIRGW
jgi:hypothetical protein